MRFGKTLLIAAIVLLACIVPAGAAHAEPQMQFEILTTDELTDSSRAPPVYGDVRQGEVDHHIHTPGNDRTLEVSLTWDRTSGNDLDLDVTPPNGRVSRLHDLDDGRTDGKIAFRTALNKNTINRPWGFDVVGAQVSGTQSYTLIINSY